MATLLPAALLLLLLPGSPAQDPKQTPFSIMVSNSVKHTASRTFKASVSPGGILLGGMRRLQDSDDGFRFKYTEDVNYGPFLESVNGLAGCHDHRTYWELLVQKPNSHAIPLNVGIGCYIPSAGDVIILNFTKY
ncbi:cobalamin binding intrinsic factor-like [Pseudoliparis swirei]|uniref:cobalamin binding intrinsic factor-like n=1 Tax=Pseudoliparis swirei TaxID=2059687 RepID=UPI0024BE8631|nr:cobalamin binding intrinsic factor-like [Pseudoliparis swirei]XP_056297302.1 cobalamin binding intrinsic factor-like [Pseudoliparis swirei]